VNEKELIQRALQIAGFERLNPVQREAIKKGLLKRKNLVIAAPTASGKTFVSEMAMLNTFHQRLGKTIYMVPLVSLANEKFQHFRQKYEPLGIRVAMSVGDYDSQDPWLARYDLICVSNEKMDSLIRHGAPWIRDIGLVVCDEIHLLQDPTRGPTLEITLTRLRDIVPGAQYLSLSATIKNVHELASWLDADTVISDWRPVKLYTGTGFPWQIKFLERKGYELNPQLPLEGAIAEHTLRLGKQALFFVATRRSAESLAEKLSKLVKQHLTRREKEMLRRLATQIEHVLEVPTRQCRRAARCIANGVGFHHAGLLHEQKRLIEDGFRRGLIKMICATPTLAYGVNLPSFRVVMRDLKRYYPGVGAAFIPILEVHQMIGRCGRPQYDRWGEGILLAKSEEEAKELVNHYIFGEPEDIVSKLGVEPMLRMHTLALIASEAVRSEQSLLRFFSKTFFAFQYGDISRIEGKILDVLDLLSEWQFIARDGSRLKVTRLGRRVSELYIDPLTAHYFVGCLSRAMKVAIRPFSFLHTISHSLEMRPLLRVRTGEWSELTEEITKREGQFLQEVPAEWDIEWDDFVRSVKTALMFEAWINEMTEDDILAQFRCTPGELRGRLQNADWLTYALHELALLLGYKPLLREIRKVRLRLQHGVKEELIPLVRLRQIGRIRARRLYDAGLKRVANLRRVSLRRLAEIVGPKIAALIKEQLGEVKPGRKRRQAILKISY
jgi:helicase